jgi:LCP family protein required for cell wall assembly
VLGLVLVLSSAAGLWGLRALTDRYEHAVARQDLLDPTARHPTSAATGPLNYLLVGSDQRTSGPGADARSDTILIAHVPAGQRRAYLISVPRDLQVRIPARPGWPGGQDKVNAAFEYGGGGTGGTRLLSATLTALTGIRFDGAALVDFTGFQQVVDLLGGVDMCVDTPVRSIHTGARYDPGCRRMTGPQALDYVRQRYDLPHGDFDRQRHQQQLLQAILRRCTDGDLLSDPLRLDRVIRAIGASFVLDSNGVPVDELVFALRGLHADALLGVQLPAHPEDVDGVSYVLLDPEADGLFRAVRDRTVDAWARDNPRWINQL